MQAAELVSEVRIDVDDIAALARIADYAGAPMLQGRAGDYYVMDGNRVFRYMVRAIGGDPITPASLAPVRAPAERVHASEPAPAPVRPRRTRPLQAERVGSGRATDEAARRGRVRWAPVVLAVLVLVAAPTAQTAANTVAGSKAKDDSRTAGANDIKPTECAALTLTAKVAGSGTITGTSANELLTGSGNVDTISGGSGNDCLLGGAGNDTLNGGQGTDVCIGGAGTDTFSNCETQIQ